MDSVCGFSVCAAGCFWLNGCLYGGFAYAAQKIQVDIRLIHSFCDNLILNCRERAYMTAETIPASRLYAPATIRRAHPDDVAACAQICYDAFYKINTQHAFPPDIPSPELASWILS